MADDSLVLIANARIPSERAQSLQVVQMAAAFARAGFNTRLLHARRHPTPALPPGVDLWQHYAVGPGARPEVEAVPCFDWIDRVPRFLQYVPARLQEESFARNAARWVLANCPGAAVLSREAESARTLLQSGFERVFLEVHRVPGGEYRRRVLKNAAARSRGVLAISEGVREDLVSLGLDPDQLRVEHDGYEAARFASLPTRAEARRELGLDEARPLVVYTGGLLEWKGVDLALEAARELPDVQFVVAGGMTADVERLRARFGQLANVRIDGFQAPERVVLYLAAGDVGLVPNRSQPAISARYTSPLKIFESLAAGLPLVVSDLPSLRAILSEDEAFFVAPDSAESLRVGIETALAEEEQRRGMCAALRARASEFSWDARAARIREWMRARMSS